MDTKFFRDGQFTYLYDGRGLTIKEYLGKNSVVEVPSEVDGLIVKQIGDSAFFDIPFIERIVLPEGICYAGDFAFADCTHLKEVIMPESCNLMGIGMFLRCEELERVSLSSHMVSIKDFTFSGCRNLRFFSYFPQMKYIGNMAFENCTHLQDADLSNCVRIGDEVFSGCTNLLHVQLPSSGNCEFGSNIFRGCNCIPELASRFTGAHSVDPESIYFPQS